MHSSAECGHPESVLSMGGYRLGADECLPENVPQTALFINDE